MGVEIGGKEGRGGLTADHFWRPDVHFLESHGNKMFTFANPLILRAFWGVHGEIASQ